MTLTLYGHPLSSFTHKVLVAMYELGLDFDFRLVDLGQPEERALMGRLSPMGKMPALRDDQAALSVAETSVIIEYLDRGHVLIPQGAAGREVRTWDRIFDMHVQGAMQPIVDARLFIDKAAEPGVTAHSRAALDRAYAAIERQLTPHESERPAGEGWIAGRFSLADCAALPALFYAGILHPFADHPHLSAYFERLIARPSAARVLDEAKPWLHMFPFHDLVPARFR